MKVFISKKDQKVILLIAFILLGLFSTVQVRTLNNRKQETRQEINIENLKKMLENEKKIGSELEKEMDGMQKAKQAYLNSLPYDDKNYQLLRNQMQYLDDLKLKAGLTDVKGSGVVITLNDAAKNQGFNTQNLIIHDEDIWKMINVLKKVGAQAISINGERIVATSEQHCGGPVIIVNKNRYVVPFKISAIGDADKMYEELNKNSFVTDMKAGGVRADISKSREIEVPKYMGSTDRLTEGLEVVEDGQ